MDIDLEQLKKAANAATPGPWATGVCGTVKDGPFPFIQSRRGPFQAVLSRQKNVVCSFKEEVVSESDAAYIAAANPAVVLALIERLDLAEARVDTILRHISSGILYSMPTEPMPGLLEKVDAIIATKYAPQIANALYNAQGKLEPLPDVTDEEGL